VPAIPINESLRRPAVALHFVGDIHARCEHDCLRGGIRLRHSRQRRFGPAVRRAANDGPVDGMGVFHRHVVIHLVKEPRDPLVLRRVDQIVDTRFTKRFDC